MFILNRHTLAGQKAGQEKYGRHAIKWSTLLDSLAWEAFIVLLTVHMKKKVKGLGVNVRLSVDQFRKVTNSDIRVSDTVQPSDKQFGWRILTHLVPLKLIDNEVFQGETQFYSPPLYRGCSRFN